LLVALDLLFPDWMFEQLFRPKRHLIKTMGHCFLVKKNSKKKQKSKIKNADLSRIT